jgi:hypothetical protein
MANVKDYATWIFPRQSLPLPGFPTSRNMSRARWYLEYCLTNDTLAMNSHFGGQTSLRIGDILEPYWIDGPDSQGNVAEINVLRLFCLRCNDKWKKFPCEAVHNSTMDVLEVTQTFNVSTPASRYRITLPQPDILEHDDSDESAAYSCALQRESSLDERVTDLDRQAFSEVFFVLGSHIDEQHYIHNISKPGGVPFSQDDEEQATFPAFVFPSTGVIGNLSESEFLSWPSSKRVENVMREFNVYSIYGREPVIQTPTNIQADDVLEPRWIEHSSYPVKSLGLACIVCPEKNGTARYSRWHCDYFNGPKVTEFYLPIQLLSPGGAGIEVRIPSSRHSETIAACAFHLNFSTPSGTEVVISSRVFFVADGSSMRKEQHRFNLTQVLGVPTGIYPDNLPDSKSTDFYSSFATSRGSRKLGPGTIVGVVFGSVSSCALALWLWRCWRRKAKMTKMGNQVGPPQAEPNTVVRSEADVHIALQPRGEREMSTSLPQSGTLAHADPICVANGERMTEETFAEPPPAYHKVVNNPR